MNASGRGNPMPGHARVVPVYAVPPIKKPIPDWQMEMN